MNLEKQRPEKETPMDLTTWMNNYTTQSDFTLVGFFSQSKHPALLAVVIFVVFLMALSGNALLILLVLSDTHLHTPMYFFISQLSLMDMMYISVTVPKMLTDQVLGSHKISAAACGMQMFLYVTLAGSEFFLLAAMSYDRYVAICHPLRYPVLMNYRVCLLLMSVCWILGSLDGFMFTPITMTFPFCGSREIHHFFCEVPAVTKLSCSDTWLYETLMMNSPKGRNKALATCSSHLTVVSLYFGQAIFIYMTPTSSHTPDQDQREKLIAIVGTLLLKMENWLRKRNTQR